ncbi:MAG: peptidoglycan-associated lipoprotein Pal [Candidatus Electrothrix sp. AR5]|nr:peptidoglycan-associated lipoprotein Pal [Candidatus Electrothrix sp. AR5]
MDSGAMDSEEIASLADDLPMPEDDNNTPIIETLDAGSGAGEQKLGFGSRDNKSAAYKKEHGRSSIQLKPVYFDFDKSNIRNNQIAHIEHNGEYLKSNVASKVLIEGNCDETGTNEYNLALGERRAMNAKKYLIKLGVKSSRIRTVSYGEERPLFTGSEDSDYAYNRRDDFILE